MCDGGTVGSGGGWEYSHNGALYFNASSSSESGRNGNSFFRMCMLVGSLFLMRIYSSLWIVLMGLMMF